MSARRTITAERRLRPIRLGFLVRPDDEANLRRVFQMNTVLWGGSYNAIIPAIRRLPRALKDRTDRTARQYMSGYLDAFLPDYLVPMEADLAELVDFPPERTIRPTDVLDPGADEPVGYGLGVSSVYAALFEREFKFVRRNPAEVLLPRVSDPKLSLLGAACFGEFPVGPGLSVFEEHYKEAFSPAELKVTAANLYDALRPGVANPQSIATAEIHGTTRGWRDTLTLFYMDGGSALDVLDFWNLRALGWPVLPVPRQWAEDLRAACEGLIAETYRPLRGNPDLMLHATVQASRSVDREEVETFVRSLARPAGDALS
jgi:hypothetical protein